MLKILLTLCALSFALPAQQPAEVKVGTWNIEFYGANHRNFRRDTPPRDDADRDQIAARIRALGVQALAVQEICGAQPLEDLVKRIGPTWRAVLGTTGEWTDGKTQQAVGFVYDSEALTLVHAEELLDFPSDLDGLAVFHRKPVTACFRHRASGADFRLVTVHLKAGRKDRDLAKRRAEAATLHAWVERLQAAEGEDQDIAILGDFNSTYGAEPAELLAQGGAMALLEQRKPTPTILWFDDPIDQIAVGRGFEEVDRRSLMAHDVQGEQERLDFRKSCSDHFPCTMVLRAVRDDDPGATFAKGPAAQVLPVSRRAASGETPPRRIGAGADVWPVPVGQNVTVVTSDSRLTGPLVAPLPTERGWVVLQVAGQQVAVPMSQVRSLWIAK
jgi:endonuclease/exonuclease/phosphatase family metal-dependent hydrolase